MHKGVLGDGYMQRLVIPLGLTGCQANAFDSLANGIISDAGLLDWMSLMDSTSRAERKTNLKVLRR